MRVDFKNLKALIFPSSFLERQFKTLWEDGKWACSKYCIHITHQTRTTSHKTFKHLSLEETLDQVVSDIIDFISCSISALLWSTVLLARFPVGDSVAVVVLTSSSAMLYKSTQHKTCDVCLVRKVKHNVSPRYEGFSMEGCPKVKSPVTEIWWE